jgi:hypothetical protein
MKEISYYTEKLKKIGIRKFIKLAHAKTIRTSYPCTISVERMTSPGAFRLQNVEKDKRLTVFYDLKNTR